MAIKHWTNASADNLWSTAGNWDPSGVPATTDNVIIGVRTNANINGETVTYVATVEVWPSYTGLIGSQVTPLTFENATPANMTEFIFAGRGKTYIDTDADVTILRVHSKSQLRTADLFNVDGLVTDLYVASGYVNILGAIATCHVDWISQRNGDAVVVLDSGATSLATLRQNGGLVTLNQAVTTLDLRGGTCISAAGAITTIDCGGGAVILSGSGVTYGTTRVHAGGRVDCSQSTNNRTFTNLTVRADGLFDARGGGVRSVVFSNPPILHGREAKILPEGVGGQAPVSYK